MLINGTRVQVVKPKGVTDAEDEYYLSLYNGKKGEVTALKNNCVEVKLDGVERLAYFYEHELQKIKR